MEVVLKSSDYRGVEKVNDNVVWLSYRKDRKGLGASRPAYYQEHPTQEAATEAASSRTSHSENTEDRPWLFGFIGVIRDMRKLKNGGKREGAGCPGKPANQRRNHRWSLWATRYLNDMLEEHFAAESLAQGKEPHSSALLEALMVKTSAAVLAGETRLMDFPIFDDRDLDIRFKEYAVRVTDAANAQLKAVMEKHSIGNKQQFLLRLIYSALAPANEARQVAGSK